MERYVDNVCREAEIRKGEISNTLSVNTLYLGGGTPSVLPLYLLSRLAGCLERYSPFEEFTIEVNPEDIIDKGLEYAEGLKSLGVNRISMGVQSFEDSILKWMNRRHSSASAVRAFGILREAGFSNIGIDLIFGISQLSDEIWIETIKKAIELRPEHISAYQLSIEEDSALAKKIENGQYAEASESKCRSQYDILCEMLRAAGYRHYEVSNFALPGYEARHNSAYWKRVPYAGLGASAHSFSGRKRSWNSSEIPDYTPDYEILDAEDEKIETIMLCLRTEEGLEEAAIRALCRKDVLEALAGAGAIIIENGIVRIPEDHFFVSDEIIKELI